MLVKVQNICTPHIITGGNAKYSDHLGKWLENLIKLYIHINTYHVVESISHVLLCDLMECSTTGFTISQSLLKLMSIESTLPSNHLIFYCPLLLLPSVFLSIRVFSNKSALGIRWPKYWSFSISPSSEYLGLISFRIVWFDLC